MPLSGTISASAGSGGNKDLTQGYQPLLLATITFSDGTVLRLSTHPLNTAEGGFQYGGHDYFARLLDENIEAVQAMSENGIDVPPAMSLKIADADKSIWTNYEMAHGFKGAELDLDLVLYEAGTGNFSSDSYRKFTGICDPALIDEITLTVSATSKLNMQKVLLPIFPVQQRCPWIFPTNAAGRADALSNPDSPFFPCGYSPDIAGGVGNTSTPNQVDSSGNPLTDSSGNFVQCDYTRTGCTLRGMFTKDSSNRQTGHFGGVEWDPPLWWKSKSYLQGKTISGINAPNDQRYNDYVPLIYGQVFVDGVVLNVIGDANSTRMEVLVTKGQLDQPSHATMSSGGVKMVIVNGVAVPYNFQQVGGPPPGDALFEWQYVNTGGRTSAPNALAGYTDSGGNPLGDPYGNLCVIVVVVPIVLVDSQSVPTVQILAVGPAVRVWYTSDPGGGLTDPSCPGFFYLNQSTGGSPAPASGPPVWPATGQGNPVWVLMDLLIRAGWTYSELNISSFIAAAEVSIAQISYTNNAGSATTFNVDGSPHLRYSCSLAVGGARRRTGADVIQGVRDCCKAMLIPNDRTGLLQILIKQTLADQQPSAIAGSNQGSTVASITATGSAASGYSAYDFDETSIMVDDNGASTLKISQRRVADSPNSISTQFQDQDNQFVVDSMTELDPVDVARAQQTVVGGQLGDGLNSYDQGQRVFETKFAETFRGNPRGDSGGTLVFEFQSSQKIAHLQVGHICRFSHQQLSLSLQKVRVVKIQPSKDFETAMIALQWHEDRWYTDGYGQQGMPIYSANNKQLLNRPPFPLQPFTEAPTLGDSIFDASDWSFGAALIYGQAKDGSPLVTLQITSVFPVNSFATLQAPLIALQGTVAENPTSYIDAGQVLYAVVCPTDSSSPAKYAPPQLVPCTIAIPPGASNDWQFTIAVASWPPGTSGWALFAGPNVSMMTLQSSGDGTPSTIVFSGFKPAGDPFPTGSINVRQLAPPDVNFDHITVRIKLQLHGGVWGRAVDVVGPNTLQFIGAQWTPNQWAGYDISITWSSLAASTQTNQPIRSYRVASNTADTLTVEVPTPVHGRTSLQAVAGDVCVMRTRPDTFTALTIGDSNFVNNTTPSDPTSIGGLAPNEGNFVVRLWAGSGAGQWRNVVSNTPTVYTVDQPFNPIPDATTRFWIEEAQWQPGTDSSQPQNSSLTTGLFTGNVPIANYAGESIVVQAMTVDPNGRMCFEQYAPIRDMYVPGSQGSREVTASDTLQSTDCTIHFDASSGDIVFTLLDYGEIPDRKFYFFRDDSSANSVTIETASPTDVFPDGTTSFTLVLGKPAFLKIPGA